MHAFLYFLHFSRTGDIVKRCQRCVIDSSSTLSRDHHVSHVPTKEQKRRRAEGLGILPRQRRCNGIVTLVTSTTPQSLACNCTLSRCLIHGAPERGWDGAGGGGRQGKEERLDGTRREVDGRRRVRPAVLVLIAQMVQFHVIPTQRRALCCFRAVESDGSLLPHSGGALLLFSSFSLLLLLYAQIEQQVRDHGSSALSSRRLTRFQFHFLFFSSTSIDGKRLNENGENPQDIVAREGCCSDIIARSDLILARAMNETYEILAGRLKERSPERTFLAGT